MTGVGDDHAPRITQVVARAFTIPTDEPESDGTLVWTSTTMLVVEVSAGEARGIGYSYTHEAAASIVATVLADAVRGRGAMDVAGSWDAMRRAIRNLGRPGIVAAAISAVDAALWDLKARLLELPLVSLLGQLRDAIALYGSGGFTSYSLDRLHAQLHGWAAEGFRLVKMKVGRDPATDPQRVRTARQAVGEDVELFVDANGAYDRKRALAWAQRFADAGVTWFEEPVSSDDLAGLRLLRDRAPAGLEIAAGEYGDDATYFRRMLDAGAVDVLQADATRCQGVTGFVRAAELCGAFQIPLSAHTAPALHLHPCCALAPVRHLEWFHDHVRIERMLFDGVAEPAHGMLRPDVARPGLGIALREPDAERFRVR